MQAVDNFLKPLDEALGIPKFTFSTLYGSTLAGVSSTAIATIVGGASLGTAIVTVGLPTAAVSALAYLINSLALKACRNLNLIDYENSFTNLLGRGVVANANLFFLNVITAPFPLFRINLLFGLAITEMWFVFGLFYLDSPCSIPDMTMVSGSIWLQNLGAFVRA